MMAEDDPYSKLKPAPPTPPEEICVCEQTYPFILCYHFSDNPIRCAHCKNEVAPERWQPSTVSVDAIASWRQFYSCFYHLWLDSGAYEDWARTILSDPYSPVNERGYQVCTDISLRRPCYYWWFQDVGMEDFEELETCPKCHAELVENFGKLVCERCFIVVANWL
jgi:hypothetical protein